MLKRFFIILFCFQFVACASPNPNADTPSKSIARETAADIASVKKFCSNLLWKEDYQFKFDEFCNAREKYEGQTITAAHFGNWRTMNAEELMALLELHTQQTYELTKGLDRDQLSARKSLRLRDKILELQTAEKNLHRRVRKLMAFWYQITHEETVKRTLKDKVMIRLLFSKLREKDKLDRLEGELSTRGMIPVLAQAGMIDNPTWWELEKRSLRRDANILQGVVALALSAPSLITSGFPLVVIPEFDFDSARKLANEYEDVVAEKGHQGAVQHVLEKSKPRTTKNSYYRVIARYANIAMFAAAISWTAYDHHVQKQEANAAAAKIIYGAMETPADKRPDSDKLKSYADELAEEMIKRQEESGVKLSPAQKAEIYKMFRDNATAIASESTPKSE